MAKPPVDVALQWTHDLVFETEVAGGRGPLVDGDAVAGVSPVQGLALALGACMGVDVVMIVKKGRHDLQGLRVRVVGERADGPPAYFTSYTIEFEVKGPVPDAVLQRAIDLSRDTYCSVWHSLRRDTPLHVRFTRVDD
jgi:putative redox protein